MTEKIPCPHCGCTQVFLQLEQDYICDRVPDGQIVSAIPEDEPRLIRASCNGCGGVFEDARLVLALPNGATVRRRFVYTKD